MDKTVHKLLNQQINKEFYSAYLYLEFSNYFKSKGLDGFANWYMIQAQEERDHAMLFYTYLQNQNQTVTLESIDKPDPSISCHMDVLKAGLTLNDPTQSEQVDETCRSGRVILCLKSLGITAFLKISCQNGYETLKFKPLQTEVENIKVRRFEPHYLIWRSC